MSRFTSIFEASKKGHSINYIIAPSTIYGVAPENPVHKISQQVPNLIETAVKKRQTVYAGEGASLPSSTLLVENQS